MKLALMALVVVSFVVMGCVATVYPDCAQNYNSCRQACGQDLTGTCERACVNAYNSCVQTSTPTGLPTARSFCGWCGSTCTFTEPGEECAYFPLEGYGCAEINNECRMIRTATPTPTPTSTSTVYPGQARCVYCGTGCAWSNDPARDCPPTEPSGDYRCEARSGQCVKVQNTPTPTPTPTPTTISGSYACGWCGTKCQRKTPGMMCEEIAPPQGYDCVESSNDCVPMYNGRVTSCADSDGGQNIYQKGTVTTPMGPWARPGFGATVNPSARAEYIDHCTGTQPGTSNQIVEYWCQPTGTGEHEMKGDVFNCPSNVCRDGACVS